METRVCPFVYVLYAGSVIFKQSANLEYNVLLITSNPNIRNLFIWATTIFENFGYF
ncbi:hypothetical protein C2G38_2128535 [Gigaspora rosea]|uniref:Uncharacterized protein n=1 Tax=Gigaspora rosea TaxID=44941 RepID=A0A397TVY0_9GLOM|nr:hypothetical protein C2G38_2128535 [Gigaspora rosea]